MGRYNDITDIQIASLDDDKAQRVARLIAETSAPLDLAIAAVQRAHDHDAQPQHEGYYNTSLFERIFGR